MVMRKVILGLLMLMTAAAAQQHQKPLTLKECVRIAWGEQPQIAIAERNWRIAKERFKSVRANLFPQLSAGYRFSHFCLLALAFRSVLGHSFDKSLLS